MMRCSSSLQRTICVLFPVVCMHSCGAIRQRQGALSSMHHRRLTPPPHPSSSSLRLAAASRSEGFLPTAARAGALWGPAGSAAAGRALPRQSLGPVREPSETSLARVPQPAGICCTRRATDRGLSLSLSLSRSLSLSLSLSLSRTLCLWAPLPRLLVLCTAGWSRQRQA